jgi:2-C-methyl-D-erythritol 2,4-cyclodiphosphate synthase
VRIGFGSDFHKLKKGRKLYLGGVEIPFEKGSLGHSDGDVVLHALTDAILGSISKGDIGDHFRDSDPKWKDKRSEIFLKYALKLLKEQNYKIENVDITLILEKPKLFNYKEQIRKNISLLLGIDESCVSFKAKTKEGVGAIGKGDALECYAVVLASQVKQITIGKTKKKK